MRNLTPRTAVRPLVLFLLLVAGLGRPACSQEAEPPPVRPLRTGGLKAEVAALIMSGQQGGGLPIEVLAFPVPAEEGKARVPILVEIAGAALLAGHAAGPLRFEIYAYALAAGGGLQDSLIQTFEVDPERLSPRLETGGVKFSGEIELLPGDYSLRVLVRQSGSEEVGARTLPLAVPGADDERPVLLPPLVSEPEGAWLELSEAREPGAPRRQPLQLLAEPAAAKPLLPLGRDVVLRVPAYHLEAVGSEIGIEIRGLEGRSIELPARVSGYGPAGTNGLRQLTASFTPDGVRPGDYELRVVLAVGGGGPLTSPFLPVRFADPETGGRVWAAEASAGKADVARSAPPEESVAAAPKRASLKDVRPIAAAYAAALRALAAGDDRTARARLFELGRDLARDRGQAGLKLLDRVELAAARSLAQSEPESLAPVTALHHWLYREARRRELALLSTHARGSTLRLAEMSLDFPSVASQKRAARVLASIGGTLQQAAQIRFSERVFRRALVVDADNRAALLGLAVNHEKIGDWEQAVDYLDNLVEAYPADGEARLRLAVNLRRLDRKRAAERHLAEILAGEPERWILSLACQELARLHAGRGEIDEAVEVLRAGIARLPGSQKLYLQLAFLHDARQETDEARRTLAEMSLRASSRGESPRHRYTHWPTAALAEARRELEAEAATRRGDLAAALETSGWPLKGRI